MPTALFTKYKGFLCNLFLLWEQQRHLRFRAPGHNELKIKSHQLYHMNTLTLLPENYLTLHEPFQIWMFLVISLIHKLASVRNHEHVITGDLKVIENAKQRELVAKGQKCREPNWVNWKATETMFLESIDLSIQKRVQKGPSRTQISLWMERLVEGISWRLDFRSERAL